VSKLLEGLKALFKNNGLSSYHTSCCELLFLEVFEDFLALLLASIGEK